MTSVKFVYTKQSERPEDLTYLPQLPQQVLDRHGAKVLDPTRAMVSQIAEDEPVFVPRATVYRAGTLLVSDATRQLTSFGEIQELLRNELGLELADDDRADEARSTDATAVELTSLPRPMALRAATTATTPVNVDAWQVLQHLRLATDGRRRVRPLARAAVQGLFLDHLMLSTPVSYEGAPNEGSGGWGDGYGRVPGSGRIPVALAAAPPDCGELSEEGFGRRPVVAVVDTGIRAHPWFGTSEAQLEPPDGGFLAVWPELQDEILAVERGAGTQPAQELSSYVDDPVTNEPLRGVLAKDLGHGTFIAGIIRQAAPKATVLAIRVMHSDGVAYESDVLCALHRIAERVRTAQADNKPDQMIDIVSMSFGYFEEMAEDPNYTSQLKNAVQKLAELGVLVVAAAGNHATSRRFYPAAFAADLPETDDRPQVTSVGALNPNDTKALFSNDDYWVNCWATGAGVVSAYPTDVRGPETGEIVLPALSRSSFDPDDYTCGFAVWAGTSFAAPLAAATLANSLIEVGTPEQGKAEGKTLTTVDLETTVKRAKAAMQRAKSGAA